MFLIPSGGNIFLLTYFTPSTEVFCALNPVFAYLLFVYYPSVSTSPLPPVVDFVFDGLV